MSKSTLINAGNGQQISAIYKSGYNDEGESFDRSLVVMCHDFPGHKSGNNDLFADLEFQLSKQGHHTLRFDFRGCGESDGKQEDFTLGSACDDLRAVRKWAQRQGYQSFAYIGEGLGATVAMMNTADDVRVFLALWPVLDLKHFSKAAFDIEGSEAHTLDKGYAVIEGHKIGTHLLNEMSKTNLQRALNGVKMPTMIFHGAQDEKIPIEHLDLMREHVRSPRIEITSFQDGREGLQKLNHRKAIFYQTQQFVEKYA